MNSVLFYHNQQIKGVCLATVNVKPDEGVKGCRVLVQYETQPFVVLNAPTAPFQSQPCLFSLSRLRQFVFYPLLPEYFSSHCGWR